MTNHVAPFEVDSIQYPPLEVIIHLSKSLSISDVTFEVANKSNLWRHIRGCI